MPATTRSPKGVARREQILQTAMSVLAREGYRKTSMRAIGRELSIEPAHILYYFDGREDLLRNVVERWDELARDELGDGLEPKSALDAFVQRIRGNLRIPGITHVYLATVAEAADREHAAHEFFRQRFVHVREVLERAIRYEQRAGTIRAELDASQEARKLVALSDGLQLQAMFDDGIDAPAELEAAISALRAE
jgi:AcrR family transcriptional regulator